MPVSNNYQRKFRTQTHPTIQPVQPTQHMQPVYQPVVYQPVQPVKPEQPVRRRQQRRKRHSLLAALLMAIGAVTIFVLLMRYAIVPLLVLLPQWMGGAA